MPYSIKGFFEINEDMVQILLVLEVLFTQDSEVEDLFCGASSGSEPSLFFNRVKCHNKHCHRFGSAEFYTGSIQKISYCQNHIAFYNVYILVTMFHRSIELKITIDYNVQYRRQDCSCSYNSVQDLFTLYKYVIGFININVFFFFFYQIFVIFECVIASE